MKKLLLVLMVGGLLFTSAIAHALEAEDYLFVNYDFISPEAEGEVIGSYGITPAIKMKESSVAIDDHGNIFAVETWSGGENPVDTIMMYVKDLDYNHVAVFASALNGYSIDGISVDKDGNMFCVLTKTEQQIYPPYGDTTDRVIIKISGFSSHQKQLDERFEQLQYQINDLELKLDRRVRNLLRQIRRSRNMVYRIIRWIYSTHGLKWF